MACLNSRQGGYGCRAAAQNPRAAYWNASPYASPNYTDASQYRPFAPPFYCGPCGPTSACNNCSAPCPPGPPPSSDYYNVVYGYFSQTSSLALEAGGVVPFNGTSNSTGITVTGGTATLSEAGVYMVTLNTNIPASSMLTTTFSLQLNGAVVPGGSISVNKTDTDSTLSASAQTVFASPADAVLRVVSSASANLTAASTSDPLFTITVVRVA